MYFYEYCFFFFLIYGFIYFLNTKCATEACAPGPGVKHQGGTRSGVSKLEVKSCFSNVEKYDAA